MRTSITFSLSVSIVVLILYIRRESVQNMRTSRADEAGAESPDLTDYLTSPNFVNHFPQEKVFFSSQSLHYCNKLDPVGSTVCYEMMKLCSGSVQDTMRRQQLVIDDTGSVEGIYAFIYCTKWRSEELPNILFCIGFGTSIAHIKHFR